tara:strand:- start:1 stop:144 length:144 start_codon:yes stop_codon:yes gene_type:complete
VQKDTTKNQEAINSGSIFRSEFVTGVDWSELVLLSLITEKHIQAAEQ